MCRHRINGKRTRLFFAVILEPPIYRRTATLVLLLLNPVCTGEEIVTHLDGVMKQFVKQDCTLANGVIGIRAQYWIKKELLAQNDGAANAAC
jgi:hypothetical protein